MLESFRRVGRADFPRHGNLSRPCCFLKNMVSRGQTSLHGRVIAESLRGLFVCGARTSTSSLDTITGKIMDLKKKKIPKCFYPDVIRKRGKLDLW